MSEWPSAVLTSEILITLDHSAMIQYLFLIIQTYLTNLLGLGPGDESGLVVQEDILLLLESTFRLIRHLVSLILSLLKYF